MAKPLDPALNIVNISDH